jgi:6-phosphogluconolactonase
MKTRLLSICLVSLTTLGAATRSSRTEDGVRGVLVFVGTYTNAKSKGIYAYRLKYQTGSLAALGLVAETQNPSFLATHPNGRFLYSVGEVNSFAGRPGGLVSAYAIDAGTGRLTLLNQQSSGGAGPCHAALDRAGKRLFVANYTGGSVSVFPVGSDGSLGAAAAFVQHQGSGVNPARQKGPHAHGVYPDATGRYLIVADLGLDRLFVYRLEGENGTLVPNDPPFAAVKPGAGPRHFAFSTDGRLGFVINELDSTLTVFRFDAGTGVLKEQQTVSTLPSGWAGQNWTAEVAVHPSLPVVYGSNRGHDSIHIWRIDPRTARLTSLALESTQGKTPRNFAIDPSGKYLFAANQHSDSIVVFKIDSRTGLLEATGTVLQVGNPVCVAFAPTGGS